MKKTLLFFLLIIPFFGYSQNYQCVQAGVKHYFINGNGYLRGIRIDSVITLGDTTVYYPFHTPRGRYLSMPLPNTLDSTGGSWLGKKVVQKSDGTFLFDNLWHDTVVIKTQANIGDSWIFYSDTTSLFYEADLIGTDTMTILGSVDSIKRILITAHNALGIVTADPVDSFQILLSKNYGFAQIFDLFTFPYHGPDSAYATGLDYYLDNSLGWVQEFSLIPEVFSIHNNFNNSIFKIISLINPTRQELYDWNIGDVYEYSTCNGLLQWPTQFCNPVLAYYLDTITNKIVSVSNTQFYYSGLLSNYSSPTSGFMISSGGTYSTTTNNGTYTCGNSYLIDTSVMPEEYNQPYIYYYSPNDTSYCLESPLYGSNNSYIRGTQYQPPFEGIWSTVLNKLGIGLVHNYSVGEDAGFLVTDQTLFYYYRNGSPCGTYGQLNLGVESFVKDDQFQIFPNPAADELTIKTTSTIPYTITLFNMLGQTVEAIQTTKQEQTINVANMPPGVYNVSIIDGGGNRYNDKVVVVH